MPGKIEMIFETYPINMTKETTHKEELLASVQKAFSNFLLQLEKFSPQKINVIPYEGSWTAAQVADHVTKSNLSITRALQLQGTVINRNPFDRVKELKDIFLDFNSKLEAPPFIQPDQQVYDKSRLIGKLLESVSTLKEAGKRTELLEMINHSAFGDITKFEILHFVLYHTQRHTHQLQKIAGRLNLDRL
jgi:hypothetical protein